MIVDASVSVVLLSDLDIVWGRLLGIDVVGEEVCGDVGCGLRPSDQEALCVEAGLRVRARHFEGVGS